MGYGKGISQRQPVDPQSKALATDVSACSLYVGDVMHARLKPVTHRFSYKVFSILLDLDRVEEATRSAVFSHNRFNLLSFYDRDHGRRDGSSLRAHADEQLARAGINAPAAKVLLLCYPRILGYVFNPISVYFCLDASGAPIALIYEVRNTFGGLHTYTLPIKAGELSPAGVRQECDKAFYVSPFIEMAMRYAFRVTLPSQDVRLRILESDLEGPLLSATFAGERRPATTIEFLKLFVIIPWASVKIISAIHFEALRLWLKGAKPVPRRTQNKLPGQTVSHSSGD